MSIKVMCDHEQCGATKTQGEPLILVEHATTTAASTTRTSVSQDDRLSRVSGRLRQQNKAWYSHLQMSIVTRAFVP